MTTAKQL